MTTHDELRRLAEAARERSWVRLGAYAKAVDPQTILALLDELDTKNDQIQALQRAVAAKDVALDIASEWIAHHSAAMAGEKQ